MPYPTSHRGEHPSSSEEHGWIVVEDAIDPGDLTELEEKCNEILENKETMAFDWAWEKGTPREAREFKIVQSGPTRFWPQFNEARFRLWAVEFGSALMGKQMAFWYDQFLAKPPGNSAPTLCGIRMKATGGEIWMNEGITCWMPFHDVDASNGCMHFIDRGHKDGVLPHEQPPQHRE
jgi:phytanoyl-CoA hydroxylase